MVQKVQENEPHVQSSCLQLLGHFVTVRLNGRVLWVGVTLLELTRYNAYSREHNLVSSVVRVDGVYTLI